MGKADSLLDGPALQQARHLLRAPERPDRAWPAVAAAGLLAVSALAFVAAMVLSPPLKVERVATSGR